jgi:aminoglycoside phosphotransferase family enzyme
MTQTGAIAPAESPSGPLAPLIRAMSDPGFYPEKPESVQLRQTHISYVFLAGDWVYKVKKPVRFPFLDASTLERRRALCRDEVRLNRRLAPQLYAGVLPIVGRATGYALGAAGSEAAALEFAVKMRRLDSGRFLETLVAAGRADLETIAAVARRVATFHARTGAQQSWQFGAATALWRRVMGDLESYRVFVGYTVGADEFAAIQAFCGGFLRRQWGLLDRRALAGKTRDGHGDLRAEHVWVDRDRVLIFDCIEFSDSIRHCDVASEIAFLAMDLDRLGAARLSLALVSTYRALAGDDELALLMPFYKCYRACVRGMAESARSREAEVGAAARAAARALGGRYFALARRYAALAAPAMIVVCGLAGAGKSTVARALGERLGFPVVSSDVLRKQIASVCSPPLAPAGYGRGIYCEQFNRRTYGALLNRAAQTLAAGSGVILDATFKDPTNRLLAIETARRATVAWLFVECRCEEKEALKRLDCRARQKGAASDADRRVYLRQRGEFVPLSELPAQRHLAVDTTLDSAAGALAVERRLAELHSLDR